MSAPPSSIPMTLRQLTERIKQSGYLKNVSRLSIGTIIGQAIAVLLLPIVTRLYDSADYGIAATLNAMVMIASSTIMLRMDSAIVLADSDEQAAKIIQFCGQLILGFAIVIAISALVFFGLALDLGFFPKGGPLYFWLPVWIVLGAGNILLASWANRHAAYKVLSFSRALPPLLAFIVMLSMYSWQGSTITGLVLGHISAAITLYITIFFGLRHEGKPIRHLAIDRMEIRNLLKRFKQFPTYGLLMTFLDQLTASLPLLIFTASFSPHDAACFALATNVLRLPSTVIGQGVAQVFYEMSAKLSEDAALLRSFVINNIKFLSFFSLPFLIIIVTAGPWLFEWIFGAAWRDAGEYARYLVIAIAVNLVASPVSMISSVIRKQRTHFVISLLSFAIRAAMIGIGVTSGSAYTAVILYSIGEAMMLIVFLIWVVRSVRIRA
ncbi:oligosaccharide flippase family protein [bacterium]|nr:oligosaccharide flippase family protein [bacterium]NUN46102.1 oligosaccharide flippase family protein [bacterium]